MPRALSGAVGKIDAGAQRAGHRRLDMAQLRQFGDQRRDLGGLDALDRHFEIEKPAAPQDSDNSRAALACSTPIGTASAKSPLDAVAAALDRHDRPGPPARSARSGDRRRLPSRRGCRRAAAGPAAYRGPAGPPIGRAAAARALRRTGSSAPMRAEIVPAASRSRCSTGRSTTSCVGASQPRSKGPSAKPSTISGKLATRLTVGRAKCGRSRPANRADAWRGRSRSARPRSPRRARCRSVRAPPRHKAQASSARSDPASAATSRPAGPRSRPPRASRASEHAMGAAADMAGRPAVQRPATGRYDPRPRGIGGAPSVLTGGGRAGSVADLPRIGR